MIYTVTIWPRVDAANNVTRMTSKVTQTGKKPVRRKVFLKRVRARKRERERVGLGERELLCGYIM